MIEMKFIFEFFIDESTMLSSSFKPYVMIDIIHNSLVIINWKLITIAIYNKISVIRMDIYKVTL